jgi:Uma2 family endonuclease
MVPTTLVSVEEYLTTDYSPDCDYVDGVVEERNVGQQKHAIVQTLIAGFLLRLRQALGALVLVEQRIKASPTHYRVPDVCVVLGADPDEAVITTAPFLCVEVLSPDDRMVRMREKIGDYLRMGVRYVWVVDPYSRTAWTYSSEGSFEARDGVLRTKDPDIVMPLSEVLP